MDRRARIGRAARGTVVQPAFALVVLATVLVATLVGGHRYYYCRSMDRIMAPAGCCASEREAEPSLAQSEPGAVRLLPLSSSCFEARAFGRLLSIGPVPMATIPAPALSSIVPIVPADVPRAPVALLRAERSIRAGPLSPTAARATLMVFLT